MKQKVGDRTRVPAGKRVGILGGGQLAKMLVEAASPLGLDPVIYTEAPGEGAATAGTRAVTGALDDDAALGRFLAGCDIVVYENEWVDTARLERLQGRYPAVAFRPALSALSALRDKARQKRILDGLGIPTAPYRIRPDGADAETWLDEVTAAFPDGAVLKWGQHGYDGKGVLFLAAGALAEGPTRARALAFLREAETRQAACFAEARIAFVRELAIVACRSTTGALISYPLFASEQEAGICLRILGPASALGVPAAVERAAGEYAAKLAEATEIVGCFAIELFLTADGGLLVNEIAPRVHNSGHVTQNAAATSQYENHWRAVLGWPLGAVTMAPSFAMRNLLGPPGPRLESDRIPLPEPAPGQHLHWYRKAEMRPRRKVGHLNAVGAAASETAELVAELEATVERWNEQVHAAARETERGS